MKKLFGLIILAGVLVFGLDSCGDDNALEFGDPQRPIQQFTNGLALQFASVNDIDFVRGTMMEFQKAGRITELCVLLPDDETSDIILWDLADTSFITSVTVTADSGVHTCGEINDVQVLAGSRVAVTIISDDSYTWDNGSNGIIYPRTVEDVKILGSGSRDSPVGIQFPNVFRERLHNGSADLVFEPSLE